MPSLKYFLSIFILTIFSVMLHAAPISLADLQTAAERYHLELVSPGAIDVHATHVFSRADDEGILMAAFEFEAGGYVLLSGVESARPLLAWSADAKFSGEMAPGLVDWLVGYEQQLLELRELSNEGLAAADPEWQRILSHSYSPLQPENTGVEPMLTCNWNQGNYYNNFCPADPNGPGGKVYAGCVATAMSMVMYHFKYPSQGTGSYGYNANGYGYLSADFGNTVYDWNAMENSADNHHNDEIAQLMYHCAVSVDMMFSANGSGAYTSDAATALKTYFGYSSSVTLESKWNYSNTAWAALLTQNLDGGMPIVYHGYPPTSGAGHAFVLDGYQNSDYFHFNWGWSGFYNGYFYLNALTPGGSNFSSGQGGILNIYPATNYPMGCGGTDTLTAVRGIVFDGSGPEDYEPLSDCRWVIAPDNIDYITLTFDQVRIATGDSLIIYDGAGINDPVLAVFTTDTIHSPLNSSTDKVCVRLVSDNSSEAAGFLISYVGDLIDFCQGTTVYNTPTGNLSDGSGPEDYRDGTICRWTLDPGTGQPLTLHFLMFDTYDSGDFLKVYDSGTIPSTLLGQFSGSQLPADITSPSGKMFLLFYTDQQDRGSGWEASWSSGNIGMDEFSQGSLDIWPNPASRQFLVRVEDDYILGIGLFDLTGRSMKYISNEEFNLTEITVPCEDVPDGIYLVRVRTEKGLQTRRVHVMNN